MTSELDLDDPPSAVFVTGEVLGHGALAEARARGVAVLGDLAIAGYTDSPTAALVDPPLTMVAVPAREIGMRAMFGSTAAVLPATFGLVIAHGLAASSPDGDPGKGVDPAACLPPTSSTAERATSPVTRGLLSWSTRDLRAVAQGARNSSIQRSRVPGPSSSTA